MRRKIVMPGAKTPSKARSANSLTQNQIDILSQIIAGNDPCVTLRHGHRVTNLQMFIYRGWVIYNDHDEYELTAEGKSAYKQAVRHAQKIITVQTGE